MVKDRGDKVDHEYHETARKIDHQRQPELAPHEKGIMESKLNQYGKVRGLAFGFYSEASPDMHKLIQCWVQERTKSSALALGIEEDQAALRTTGPQRYFTLNWHACSIGLGTSQDQDNKQCSFRF